MKLLPGMTANITIVTDQVTGVLKVPSTALRFRPPQEYITVMMKTLPDSVRQRWERFQQRMSGGQEVARSGGQERQEDRAGRRWGGEGRPEMSTIWVKSGDNIMPRRVRAGLSDGTYTQILGKVEEGEEVVTGMNSGMASSTQPTNPFAPQMQRGRR
jgi:HlyD family secretion protein